MADPKAIVGTESFLAAGRTLAPLATDVSFRPDGKGGWTAWAYSAAKDRAAEVVIPREAFGSDVPEVSFAMQMKDLDSIKQLFDGTKDLDITIGGDIVFSADGLRRKVAGLEVPENPGNPPSVPESRMELPAEVLFDPAKVVGVLASVDTKKVQQVRVSLSAEGVTFTAWEDRDETSVDIPADALQACDGEAEAVYSLDGLLMMLKGVPGRSVCSVRFGTDYPMVVRYRRGLAWCMYMLAPRIVEG